MKSIVEVKEVADKLTVKGYISTTHFDGKDKVTKEALDKWAKEINEGIPRANKVSIHHVREPVVAGVGVKGTARVDRLSDGEYGLYVETLVDKTKENYETTKYRIENNILDSFSIEYVADEDAPIDHTGARILNENTELYGWTLASQPMNEHAVMIKELIPKGNDSEIQNKENDNMAEDVQEPVQTPVEETRETTETQEAPTEEPKEEPKEEAKESTEEEETETEEKEQGKEVPIENKESKEVKIDTKEIVDEVVLQVKEQLSEIKLEGKTMVNTDKIENKELCEYKEALTSGKSRETLIALAGKMSDMVGFTDKGEIEGKTRAALSKVGSYKFNIEQKGANFNLEYKGLGITTNQNTDTDYLLSAAELSDVFEPFIFNMINQATVTWNILRKVDKSNKGNNQMQFTGKTAINSTASAYTGNAVSLGNTTRLKFMTKFKKYQVGIEVDGDMIAAAAGGPVGDVFAREVADSTDDLMQLMNQDLFKEVGLETAAGVIGFEYITDSAGNTTLYNLTRSTDNKLKPDNATDTYINGSSADISLGNLRKAKRQALKEGAKLENLVFICDHIQGDKFRGIYDAAQRNVPTSARFGFEGRPEFDGIPIFEDKDCNDDDWFLVDLETHQIAIWVPPTLERLGKDSDSEKGFIKTYFCTFNRAPRRMVQIYGNSTT